MTKIILIVEDDHVQTRLITEHFNDLGPLSNGDQITVVFAKTVASAAEIISKTVFDLIYLDGELTGTGLKEYPDTWELFKKLTPKHRSGIFTTTNSLRYQQQFAEYGCTHVEKTEVAQHAHTLLNTSPRAYTIGIGKLLIIQLPVSLQVYVAEITQVTPLVVCAHDSQVPLMALAENQFGILQDESILIQGTREEQQQLLEHYKRFMRPIRIEVTRIKQQLPVPSTE
jgi:CheY-like chemotaxis protein